jgi:hypothetical protein
MIERSDGSRFPHPIQSDHIHIECDFDTPLGFTPSKPPKPTSEMTFDEFIAESAKLIEEGQRRGI